MAVTKAGTAKPGAPGGGAPAGDSTETGVTETGVTERTVDIHGHRVSYRTAGAAPGSAAAHGLAQPTVLLVHGIAGDARTWDALIPLLGRWAYVVVPDLPGHGGSQPAGGDCSIAAYASSLRDLMRALDLASATVVGHSLGGGVAMQLSYMFPRSVQRLVLIAAGGLGPEVSLFLRAATLPGAELVLPVIASRPVLAAGRLVDRAGRAVGWRVRPGVAEACRGIAALARPGARTAFLRTVRASLTLAGQAVDARDRLYLTQMMPTLLVWGARDAILPVGHGYEAHQRAVGSRLKVLESAGHFPQCDEPARVAALLEQFVAETEPAALDDSDIQALVLRSR